MTGEQDMEVLTPYQTEGSMVRLHLSLTGEDKARYDRLPAGPSGKAVKVRDTYSGESFWIRRAECGAGCYCAAVVVERT